MKDAESLLPAEILSRAVRSGEEFGWRREDVADAIAAAPAAGLAVLGGQVQFRLPEGICELYWMPYEPSDRGDGESWESYTARSARETLNALQSVLSQDLVQEGVAAFEFLREKQSQGVDLQQHLLFLVVFQTREEARQARAGD